MNVDKNILKQVYGIDDDNFVLYLNNFKTLKKIINLSKLDVLPVEKVRELYNKFLYYFSLGHNIITIVNETIPDVKRLFFLNGEGNLRYKISDDGRYKQNVSFVHIVDRVCHVKLHFITTQVINDKDIIFDTIPSPSLPTQYIVNTSEGFKVLSLAQDSLILIGGKISANTTVQGNLMYIVDK